MSRQTSPRVSHRHDGLLHWILDLAVDQPFWLAGVFAHPVASSLGSCSRKAEPALEAGAPGLESTRSQEWKLSGPFHK